ncbi:MAG: hypothetical protein HDS45_00095 [Bacteroides sp.]|nr:hypothetical protein [Bacteroides sp.]
MIKKYLSREITIIENDRTMRVFKLSIAEVEYEGENKQSKIKRIKVRRFVEEEEGVEYFDIPLFFNTPELIVIEN